MATKYLVNMKNKLLLAFKGVILYATITIILLAMMAADSIVDNGYTLICVATILGMVAICKILITKKDLNALLYGNASKSNTNDEFEY